MLNPPAPGTISVDLDGEIVLGDNTGFLALREGDTIYPTGGLPILVGADPTGNGSFVPAAPYGGPTLEGVTYRISPRSGNALVAVETARLLATFQAMEGLFAFTWSIGQSEEDPGATRLGADDVWSAATELYISSTDLGGSAQGAFIDTMAGRIRLLSLDRPTVFGYANIGAVTGTGDWRKITISGIIGTPDFGNDERVALILMPSGPTGGGNFTYVAYASDDSGTDFTTTFNPALDFIAILSSETEIETPSAGDFTGLWTRYRAAGFDLTGDWVTATGYTDGQAARNVGGFYGCILDHTSGSDDDEPGVGANWETYWKLVIKDGEDGADGSNGSDGGGLKGLSLRSASTSNIDLSADLEAGDTAGGVTLVAGDAHGAFGQTDASENGVYVVPASGAAARHSSFDTWDKIAGGLFPVREGDFAGSTFSNTDSSGAGTIDTDDLTFVEQSGGDALFEEDLGKSESEMAQARANIGAGAGSGRYNYIMNGDGRINQRQASTGIADDQYGHDRHYALTQSNPIAVETLAAPADGIPAMMRLTQSHASAQRMGYAQIFKAADTYALRGNLVTLGGTLRHSSSAAVRFAILEWTGTANDVTSDVVLDWSSGTYGAGDFFLASDLTVTAVGTITPSANTLTEWAMPATVGSSANNLIVMYWTEQTSAQNETLDMDWYLVQGDATNAEVKFERRLIEEEHQMCIRIFERFYFPTSGGVMWVFGRAGNDGKSGWEFMTKWRTPAVSSNFSSGNLQLLDYASVTGISFPSGSITLRNVQLNLTASVNPVSGDVYFMQSTTSALYFQASADL